MYLVRHKRAISRDTYLSLFTLPPLQLASSKIVPMLDFLGVMEDLADESITIGVVGERRRQKIFKRAEERGILETDQQKRKSVRMFGIKWGFVLTGEDEPSSKL